jgi:hypothetical protein
MRNRTPEHAAWMGMNHRVRCRSCKDYHRYGGRGITITPAWNVFATFLADMGPSHRQNIRSTASTATARTQKKIAGGLRGPSSNTTRERRNLSPITFDGLESFERKRLSH